MTRTGNTGIVVTDVKGVFHNNFFKIVYNPERVTKRFMVSFLRMPHTQHRIRGLAGSSTIPDLNHGDFYSISIPLPSLPEQEAIAEVLECWDKAIRGYEKKIEKKRNIKKGLMQRLLSGKQRLPGFEGEWKEVRLEEMCKRITNKNIDGCDNLLTISGPQGLVNQEEYFKRRIAAKDTSGYYLLKRGQYAYNRSSCAGYPYGAIKRLSKFDEGVVSTLYLCFEIISKTTSSAFLEIYLDSGHLNRELYKIVAEGARSHGLLNVSASDFLRTELRLPPLDEQRAIATVLSSAGTEIIALESKLAILKDQKRSLLNNMVTGAMRLPQFAGASEPTGTHGDTE